MLFFHVLRRAGRGDVPARLTWPGGMNKLASSLTPAGASHLDWGQGVRIVVNWRLRDMTENRSQ